MKHLLIREIKKNSKSFFIWFIILTAINVCMLAAFGTVAEMATNTETMLAQYPEAFVKAMSLDKFDMTNILHYFASRSYILVTLFGSIYAIMLSACILSKEESEKTVEFLLSKPITRKEITTAKFCCVTLYVCLFNFLFSCINMIAMQLFKTNDFGITPFLFISLGSFFIHFIFASIGFLLSVFITKTKTVISISFGMVFVSYFFHIIVSINEKLSFLSWFSPFRYFDAESLVVSEVLEPSYLILSITVIVITTLLAYRFYSKKDITA